MNCKNNSDNKRLSIMKKVLAIIIALLPLITMGQVRVGDVALDGGKVSTVYVDGKNGKLNWVGFTCPNDDIIEQIVTIPDEEVKKFRTALNEAVIKTAEWDRKAEENKVKDYQHELPVEFPWVKYMWGVDKTFKSQNTFRLWYYRKNNETRLLIRTTVSKIADSMHNYKDFNMDFTDKEQLKQLIDLLSQEKINAALEQTKAKKEKQTPLWKIFD